MYQSIFVEYPYIQTVPLYLQRSVWLPVTLSKNEVSSSLTYALTSNFYVLSTELICFNVRLQKDTQFCFQKWRVSTKCGFFLQAINYNDAPCSSQYKCTREFSCAAGCANGT